MSKEYTFLNLALDVLTRASSPMTTSAIWEEAVKQGLDKKLKSEGKTPFNTLCALLYSITKENKHPHIERLSRRPAIFGIRKRIYENTLSEELDAKSNQEKERKDERDIHPLLTKFVINNSHFKCYTKTIFHEDSIKQKKGLAQWNHPDMVGIYFPFFENELGEKTLELLDVLQENIYKLFSFEIKRELNLSNYKQYFFQAVSNSSWAHEGYLVTLHLKEDAELKQDLERLNHAFGIGIIVLNSENVDQSEILFPARFNSRLDIDTVDTLIEHNKNFEEFIDDIVADIKDGKKVRGKYDPELSEKEISLHVKRHHLKSK